MPTTTMELKSTGNASRRVAARRALFEQTAIPVFDTSNQWYGNSVVLGADTLIGSTTVTIADTSPFAVGEQVALVDTSPSYELVTIESITASTSLTLATAAVANYTTAADARVQKLGDALEFSRISLLCMADQATAADGLTVEQSIDGENWDYISEWTTVGSTEFAASVQLVARYVRVGFLYAVIPTSFRFGAYLSTT